MLYTNNNIVYNKKKTHRQNGLNPAAEQIKTRTRSPPVYFVIIVLSSSVYNFYIVYS